MSDDFLKSAEYTAFIDGLAGVIERKQQIADVLVRQALLAWPVSSLKNLNDVDELKKFITFFCSWIRTADNQMNKIEDYTKKR